MRRHRLAGKVVYELLTPSGQVAARALADFGYGTRDVLFRNIPTGEYSRVRVLQYGRSPRHRRRSPRKTCLLVQQFGLAYLGPGDSLSLKIEIG